MKQRVTVAAIAAITVIAEAIAARDAAADAMTANAVKRKADICPPF